MGIDISTVRAVGREVSNWGRWGPNDECGTVNYITPEVTAAATRLVRRGASVSLAIPMDDTGPWEPRNVAGRFNPIHRMTRYRGDNAAGQAWGHFCSSDDMIIMGMQSSTQFDALAHLWYDDLLYNGYPADEAVTAWGARRNSIQNLVRGVVTRGILADVAQHRNLPVLEAGTSIGPGELDEVLGAAGVRPRRGDVLLVRTGRVGAQQRGETVTGPDPGLNFSCLPWLAAHKIAAVCSDNAAVESMADTGDNPRLPFHMVALRDMGLLLGELFALDDLAHECRIDGVAEFLFVAAPLNVPGAVGSPLNPLAIR
jgi:kynurenine formamidase